MLTERQKTILDAVVREYVAAAQPVASGELVRRYRFPFSPATVRNELLALDEAGFLAQPHTSAGRIPTDKGYRFFINHLMPQGDGIARGEAQALRELREFTEPMEFIRHVGRLFAELTQSFTLTGVPETSLFYKSGIREVMGEPEFSDVILMREFSALADRIEDEVRRFFDPSELGEPQVFIGQENPIRQARHCGMIISAYETPFEQESVIALIGPKRMDYEHNLALLKHFRQLLGA